MRVTLNGYVVADEDAWLYRFFGYGCYSPRDVRAALEKNPQGEELVFEINSPGGSVFAGFEMYSILRAARGGVRTAAEVQSLAASAASTMMLGCDRVLLSPVAQVMIHLPATVTDGDANDHRESIRVLEGIAVSILNAYELKCGGKADRARLEALMNAASWFPAQEALALGLADGVLYQEGEEPLALPQRVTNAVGGGIRALAASAGDMPDAAALRERYRKLADAGKAPPPAGETPAPSLGDDWRNNARLSLARAKYENLGGIPT